MSEISEKALVSAFFDLPASINPEDFDCEFYEAEVLRLLRQRQD